MTAASAHMHANALDGASSHLSTWARTHMIYQVDTQREGSNYTPYHQHVHTTFPFCSTLPAPVQHCTETLLHSVSVCVIWPPPLCHRLP